MGSVRIAAVQALAAGWLEDRDTLTLLHQTATSDDDESVRSEAVWALRRLG
jgi:HEAT repeat protein